MSGALIISNDKEQIKLLRDTLRDIGMKVSGEFSSARAAVEAYKDASTDLVIVDTFLPQTTGVELLANLKRMNEQGSFLLLNRLRTRNSLDKAFRVGAQDVLHYPVATEVLRDTLLRRQTQLTEQEAEEQKVMAAAQQAAQAPQGKPPKS